MTRICESKPDNLILEAVTRLEQLGFTSYLLSVPEHNERQLEGKVEQVKQIIQRFSYPYNRRILGAHGRFTKKDYREWPKNVEKSELTRALGRLAEPNQSKVYLFWKK